MDTAKMNELRKAFLEISEILTPQHLNSNKSLASTREHFYIAKECLKLIEHAPGDFDGSQPPYLLPLRNSFLYFLANDRYEDAIKILKGGLNKIPVQKIIEHWVLQDEDEDNDPDCFYSRFLNTEKLIAFLTQSGYEEEILELSNRKHNLNRKLALSIECSWIVLLKRFFNCIDSYENKKYPETFLEELLINLNVISSMANEITDRVVSLKFMKWFLKRQLLCIFIIIQRNQKQEGCTGNSPINTEEFETCLIETYQTYRALVISEYNYYILSTKETLENIKNSKAWCEDFPKNLFRQIEKLKNRYTDLADIFKCTLNISINLSDKDIKAFTMLQKQNMSITEFRNWIEDKTKNLETDPIPFWDGKDEAQIIQEIKSEISKDKENAYRTKFRECFTPDRLKVMVASLDNKYTNGTEYLFTSPSVKMQNEKPLETELHLLKKWGSTSSIFERDKNHTSNFGGGYFLYHNAFGLAIDPGPDFLKLLTQYSDFDITDISGIACTHTHYDHFADFNRIELGIREYNRFAGHRTLYYLLPDNNDQDMYPVKYREDQYCKDIFLESQDDKNSQINPGNPVYYIPNNDWGRQYGFKIETIQVKHEIYKTGTDIETGKDKFYKKSHALLIMPLNEGQPISRILFSGDAEYEDKNQPNIDEQKPFDKVNADFFILNFSSVRISEIVLNKPKRNQLGYSGVLNILKNNNNYKMAIISDFFEPQSEGDIRRLITESLKNENIGTDVSGKKVLTAEPGMRFHLSKESGIQIYCSPLCGEKRGFVNPVNNEVKQDQNSIFARNSKIFISCNKCKFNKKNIF